MSRLWTTVMWIGFATVTVLATRPAWSYALFGLNPTLSDLLSMRCLPRF